MATRAQDLIEDFRSSVISAAKWSGAGAQLSTTSGALIITTLTSAAYYTLNSNERVDLTESYVIVTILNAGNQALTSLEVSPIQLKLDANNILFFLISGDTLTAFRKVSGSNTSVGSIAWNSTTQKYLRIRESAGTCYWDYSANRSTWTNLGSFANPFDITLLQLALEAGTFAVEGSGTTVSFDDVNCIKSGRPSEAGNQVRAPQGMSVSSSSR